MAGKVTDCSSQTSFIQNLTFVKFPIVWNKIIKKGNADTKKCEVWLLNRVQWIGIDWLTVLSVQLYYNVQDSCISTRTTKEVSLMGDSASIIKEVHWLNQCVTINLLQWQVQSEIVKLFWLIVQHCRIASNSNCYVYCLWCHKLILCIFS